MRFNVSALEALSGINVEKGLDVFEDDIDDYVSALRSFLRNAPKAIDKLRGVAEENLPEYAVNVHGLKSMSGWICAETIQAGAIELEALAKAGDLSGVLARNEEFLKGVEAFAKELQALMGDNPAE